LLPVDAGYVFTVLVIDLAWMRHVAGEGKGYGIGVRME
jgi:hypothetical protein